MAGLIPQSFIDELLHRVDIVDVIDQRVKLRKTGKNYSALCPFHKEKSPSFSVEPEKQFYYCFGCGAGGNALGFIMDHDNKSFPEAVETLAADCGMQVPREEKNPASARRQTENQQLLDVLEQASVFYQQQLRRHPSRQRAIDYLKSRGLTGQIAKRFGIGFAPPGWDNLLKHFAAESAETEQLEKAGLVIARDAEKLQQGVPGRASSHYDRFRDRIIFPIRNNRGHVIAFGGRVLGDDKPKYLNSPETAVYHKGQELYGLYEARRSRRRLERLLVVEGYMDVVALAQHGIDYAVATLGTATSAAHLSRMFRLVSDVVYCFDGDEAGRTAAWRALQTSIPLMNDSHQVRFLFLPEGEDPDTLVRRAGQETLETLIDNATPLSEFLFDRLSKDLNLEQLDARARLASQAVPLISQFPDSLYRRLMLDRLAEITRTDRSAIDQLLKDKPAASAQSGTAPEPPADYARERPSDYFDDVAYPDDYAEAYPDHAPPEFPEDLPHAPSAGRRTGKFTGQGRNQAPRDSSRAKLSKPASLIAIELLLHQPQIALAIERDLSPLRSLDDENTTYLLELLELAKNDPTTTTYTMLGHCYGTPMGSRLTQLMKAEKITPTSGIADEFAYVLDNMLQTAEKQQFKLRLLEQLKPKLRSLKQNPEKSG